jgi:phosphate-selective porin OprO/OprP
LHLGLSVSDREPTGDAVRFRSRPESHLSPRLVDTSGFGADGVTLVDLEGALVVGPFSAQGEYIQASVDSLVGPDPDFDSFYVYGSWFLTGEHRPYKNSAGAFDRLKPRRVLGEGPGAWEIAVRYSTLDLTDSGIEGGELDDVTFGLNWYPYANVRWMLNYVMADLDGTGEGDAIQMRFQIDF